MRFAVFTVCMPDDTPEQAVSVLRELGYEGVEWRVTDQQPSADGQPGFWAGNRCTWPFASFVEDAPKIRALTEQAGLAMPSLGTYVTCQDLAAVERAMSGAAILGVPKLRVNVARYDGTASYRELREHSLTAYGEVARLAERYGVRALVEIHHRGLLPSASAAAAFLQNFDPRFVGVIHDAGNMVYEGFEAYRLGLETLGPYLGHVHIKNARWEIAGHRPDHSTEWQAVAAPLAEGIVDVPDLFRALREAGYDDWISLEDFSTERPLPARLVEDLAYLQQAAAATA